MSSRPLVPEDNPIVFIGEDDESRHSEVPVVATRDHQLIRRWAERRQALPATGEATESGPATLSVNDGGTGIRFNFPGLSRFRPIEWDEWFRNFEQYSLVFVYERDQPGHAPSSRFRLLPFVTLQTVARVV